MFKIGFIDYYLDEWHAENYPKWIEQISGNKFRVHAAYGDVEGTAFGRRSNQEFCDAHGIKLLATIEEVIAQSDCLIVLSPDNPEEHMRLAEAALKSGKPVYVDKTFANCEADAITMFDLAEAYNTPMFSTSALRYSEVYRNLPEGITNLSSQGAGTPYNYIIHQLEPIIKIMGTDVKRGVAWGSKNLTNYLLEFDSGKTAALHQHESLGFKMLAETADTTLVLEANDNFFDRLMREMLDFFALAIETAAVDRPVAREETIAVMAAREILLEALETPGEWVNRKR